LVASVFDGHGGVEVAEYLQENLNKKIKAEIRDVEVTAVPEALSSAYNAIDAQLLSIVRPLRQLAVPGSREFSKPFRVGACAISVVVAGQSIFVAFAGDCEGVLARGKSSIHLSATGVPHSANRVEEQRRLAAIHPGEENVVRCKSKMLVPAPGVRGMLGLKSEENTSCYVKSHLQPTKSFGDFYLKDKELGLVSSSRLAAEAKEGKPLSFPYITAEPEVAVFARHPADRFVILASDGLWDQLSKDEATRIVAEALQANNDADAAAKHLVEATLARAAERHDKSLEALKQVPAGKDRRRLHDDITVLVVLL
jgi:pyruvate dehydrogenase phosphatase